MAAKLYIKLVRNPSTLSRISMNLKPSDKLSGRLRVSVPAGGGQDVDRALHRRGGCAHHGARGEEIDFKKFSTHLIFMFLTSLTWSKLDHIIPSFFGLAWPIWQSSNHPSGIPEERRVPCQAGPLLRADGGCGAQDLRRRPGQIRRAGTPLPAHGQHQLLPPGTTGVGLVVHYDISGQPWGFYKFQDRSHHWWQCVKECEMASLYWSNLSVRVDICSLPNSRP